MPSARSIHVLPNGDGGWSVKRDGASRAAKRFDTKEDAVSYGRKLCEKEGANLYVHREGGGIGFKYEYIRT